MSGLRQNDEARAFTARAAMISPDRAQVERAIQRLLQRADDDGYVIIEEPSSGKFVQFAGSARDGLHLDLPVQVLSAQEQERAKALFATLGVSPSETGFLMSLDRDVEQAVELVERVFSEVYEFDADVGVNIIEPDREAADAVVETCSHCGAIAAGRRRWMFYNRWEWLFGAAIAREFHCFRCIRIMRIYAIIGFSLIAIVVGGLTAVTIWLVYFAGP